MDITPRDFFAGIALHAYLTKYPSITACENQQAMEEVLSTALLAAWETADNMIAAKARIDQEKAEKAAFEAALGGPASE